MVTVTFAVCNGVYQGFTACGHAGYAPIGQDIVCAAISALTQGAIVAIGRITSCETEQMGNAEGELRYRMYNSDHTAQILIAGMEAALMELEIEYGNYLTVCRG